MKNFNLSEVLNSFGVSDFSFLSLIKIVFLILFILFNLSLLYFEYLENRNKNDSNYIQVCGIGNEIKKIATVFVTGMGAYASYIGIKNEFKTDLEKEKFVANIKSTLDKTKEEKAKLSDLRVSENFSQRMHWDSTNRNIDKYDKIKIEESELMKEIKSNELKFESGDKSLKERILQDRHKLEELLLNKNRTYEELKENVKRGYNFNNEIINENDEKKIVEKVENIKKSSILDLDGIWSGFESLDAISKLMYTYIFSSFIILWCLFSIMLNMYGNYLLERFNLEENYPKIALIINYRRKLSKYYIISNFIIIIIMCLINIILGISIISL